VTATVSILGAGDIAGAVAHALARRESASRVLLVDASGKAAAGKALDIQQSGPIDRFHTRLDGTDDETRIVGSAVCVVADRFGQAAAEWRGEDGLAYLSRLRTYIGEAVVVFAGASQSNLLTQAVTEAEYRRERIVGSAPEALAAAIRSIVAMEARCSPAEVQLTVLGAPPDLVVPWSEASIGGYALERVFSPVQLTRIQNRSARLWPPGPYTLGLAAAIAAEAAIHASRRALSLLTVLGGEFGVRNRAGALPVLLASSGIVHTRVPSLSVRERVLVETALGG
jgi:malate dehydrogenase